MTAADSTAERYATVMNRLIADCTRLEDRVAELEAQFRAMARERDDAVAAHQTAERERDQALQDLEDIEGTFGEEDLREYCEVCNHHWHREYVTWFAHPFETEDGRYVNSACGGCFRQAGINRRNADAEVENQLKWFACCNDDRRDKDIEIPYKSVFDEITTSYVYR